MKLMKIVYDYQIFNLQKYGGVSRYLYEIATRIAKHSDFQVKILAGLYVNQYLKKCSSDLVFGWPRPKIPKSIKITSKLNSELSRIWLSKNIPDIVHETHYSTKYLPRIPLPKSCKTVITVHDMIHEKFSSLLSIDKQYGSGLSKAEAGSVILSKAEAIKCADRIICVSNNTKKDLIEILDVEPQKISVVYHGYSLQVSNYFDPHSKNLQKKIIEKIINAPYILYVGRRRWHKNFDRLLQAYASCYNLNKNFNLVCFGGGSFSRSEINSIRDLGLDQEKVVHIKGDDQTLAILYDKASTFVYPSLYEGFGISPLEAMSFGCPVVCSNVSSIPEVVGNAAEFFDPYEVDSIADSLEKVLFSSERAKNLVELGMERVKHFSWKVCAEQTKSVYLSLL